MKYNFLYSSLTSNSHTRAQARRLGAHLTTHVLYTQVSLGQWLRQEPSSQTREPMSWRVPQKAWVDAETKRSKWHSNSSQVTILKQHWQKESCLMIIKGKLCFWITGTYKGKKRKKKKETEEKGRKGQVTAAVSRVRTRTCTPARSRWDTWKGGEHYDRVRSLGVITNG